MTQFFPAAETGPDGATALDRRGMRHGFVRIDDPLEPGNDPTKAWHEGRPIPLPGALADGITEFRAEIEDSLATFDRLRDGARWLDECEQRMMDSTDFIYSGSTVDHNEPREIERLFIDVMPVDSDRRLARDISARLSWIANDESDLSLRVRFSFGHESLREWLNPEDPRGPWAERLAESVFPECSVLTDSSAVELIESVHGRRIRLAERIVYSNAPGGGAVFHHDADPEQRGVLFGQLHGHTAWLALPRPDLREQIAAATSATPESIDLDTVDEQLWRVMNMEPSFTERLANSGALYVLAPGDALVLPSPTTERAAWHSVFALGESASLAHSYGVFDREAADSDADS